MSLSSASTKSLSIPVMETNFLSTSSSSFKLKFFKPRKKWKTCKPLPIFGPNPRPLILFWSSNWFRIRNRRPPNRRRLLSDSLLAIRPWWNLTAVFRRPHFDSKYFAEKPIFACFVVLLSKRFEKKFEELFGCFSAEAGLYVGRRQSDYQPSSVLPERRVFRHKSRAEVLKIWNYKNYK